MDQQPPGRSDHAVAYAAMVPQGTLNAMQDALAGLSNQISSIMADIGQDLAIANVANLAALIPKIELAPYAAISASLAPFGDLKVDHLFPGLASALAAMPKIAVPGTALTEIARNLAGASVWQSIAVPDSLWSGVDEVLHGTAELDAFADPQVASEVEQALAVIDLEPLLTGDEEGAAAVVAQVETVVAASPLLTQLSASDIRFISVLVGLLVLVAGMGMYAAVATTDDPGDYLLAAHAAAATGLTVGGLIGNQLRKVGQQDTGTDGADQAAIDA